MQDVSTGNDFTYGFTAGVDVPFKNDKWAFTGGLNYMFSDRSTALPPISASAP